MLQYDVIIAGAGPVGNFLAKELAQEGYSVLVCEEHDIIGQPIHCTGVIGASSFRHFDLPQTGVQNKIEHMQFISPKGQDVVLRNPNHWAYIVCRHAFDSSIADWAKAKGAAYVLSAKIEYVDEKDDMCTVHLQDGRTYTSRFVVLATGSTCKLPYTMGFYRPWYFLKSAQIETEVEFKHRDTVEVFLGSKVSGGEFIWIVPVNETKARIGVFSRYNALHYLEGFLARPDIASRLRSPYLISRSVIPIGGLDDKDIKSCRVFAVGDAAGQVKPTSAGGIIFGITCARILKECLEKNMTMKGAQLQVAQEYYRRVRRRLGVEIVVGDFFRSLFSKLEDEDWNDIVALANDPQLLDMIHRKSEFDKHSKIIMWALRRPEYRRIFFKTSRQGLWPMLKRGALVWV